MPFQHASAIYQETNTRFFKAAIRRGVLYDVLREMPHLPHADWPIQEGQMREATTGERKSSPTKALILSVFVVLALYLLSVGPVMRLVLRDATLIRTFQRIYAPIIWLHENTFLHDPLEWYVELWVTEELKSK